MTWLARTLMPRITSRLASTQASVRSTSIERMSISSLTRLQATRPIEPMFRNAKMRSAAGSMTNSRKPAKLASPAEPASTSVTTPRSSPHWRGRIEMSVPPCQTWTCRSHQPGETKAPLPAMSSTSAVARQVSAHLARSCRRRRSGCRPVRPGVPRPKPTGPQIVRSSGRLGEPSFDRSSITGVPPQRSLRSRGSSRSRRPSPIICSESTASTMATPGKIISQSAVPT